MSNQPKRRKTSQTPPQPDKLQEVQKAETPRAIAPGPWVAPGPWIVKPTVRPPDVEQDLDIEKRTDEINRSGGAQ